MPRVLHHVKLRFQYAVIKALGMSTNGFLDREYYKGCRLVIIAEGLYGITMADHKDRYYKIRHVAMHWQLAEEINYSDGQRGVECRQYLPACGDAHPCTWSLPWASLEDYVFLFCLMLHALVLFLHTANSRRIAGLTLNLRETPSECYLDRVQY